MIEPDATPGLDRHPGLQRGRGDRRPASIASSPVSRCRARCSSCTTTSPTRPSLPLRKYADADPRVVPVAQHLRPGPRAGDPLRHRPRPGASRGGHHGRRQRRRRADRRALQAGRARRRHRGGVALHERRPADRRPVHQERSCRASPACRSTGSPASARATRRTRSRRTRSTSCATSTSTPTPGSRSGSSSWRRPAACAARSPRSPRSGSNARRAPRTSRSRSGSPAISSGTASRSDPGCRSKRCAPQERILRT